MARKYVEVRWEGDNGINHGLPKGAMSRKGAPGWPWGHNFRLSLDILELLTKCKRKKKVLGFLCYFIENLQYIFLRYRWKDLKKRSKVIIMVVIE